MKSAASPAVASFWEFSLAFYAVPDVAEACLALQDRSGADVNVVLFLLYHAYRGRLLDATEVERIEALAAPWREDVVAPLRGVRRRLRAPLGAFQPEATARLRTEVKRIELAAERLQQETLEQQVAPGASGEACADRAACARIHLQHYGAGSAGLDPGALARILAQFEVFGMDPHTSRDSIARGD